MAATMVLKSDYPCLEPTANLPEATRKVITAYEMVSETDGPKSGHRATTLSCLFSHFPLKR